MPAELQTIEAAVSDIKTGVATMKTEFKSSVDQLNKDVNALRDASEKGLGDAKKLDGLADNIIDIQSKLDDSIKAEKELTEKCELLETAIKRAPFGDATDGMTDDQKASVDDFFFDLMALNEKGAKTIETSNRKEFAAKYNSDLLLKYLGQSNPELSKDVTIAIGPDGGYLIPVDISNRVIMDIKESSPVRELAYVESIRTNQRIYYVDIDEVTCGWLSEKETATKTTTPTLKKVTIDCETMYAEPQISGLAIEDSGTEATNWISRHVSDKFARTEATSFLTGNSEKQPRGLLTFDAGTSWEQIEQVDVDLRSTTDGVAYKGLIDVMTALKAGYQTNAAWMVNRLTYRQILKLTDGDGRFVFLPTLETRGGFNGPTLMNQRIRLATDMPTPAQNALAILYGDFNRTYTILDRRGIFVFRDPYTAWPMVKLNFTKRVGGNVVLYESMKIGKDITA